MHVYTRQQQQPKARFRPRGAALPENDIDRRINELSARLAARWSGKHDEEGISIFEPGENFMLGLE
jgi:hypothetical protein